MSELHEKQVRFARLLPRLLDYVKILAAADPRLEVVIGETYRPPETAALYATQGRGSKTSLHMDKLAVDLLLFLNEPGGGVSLLEKTADYALLGSYWKSLDPDCCWGGDFHDRPDGDHFSITYQGRR